MRRKEMIISIFMSPEEEEGPQAKEPLPKSRFPVPRSVFLIVRRKPPSRNRVQITLAL